MVSSVRLFFNNFSHVRPHEQPRICEVEIQVAFLLRNLLIRNLGADFQISWPGNRDSQAPRRPFLRRISCSLEREGWMTPPGGCRPPEPPRSRKISYPGNRYPQAPKEPFFSQISCSLEREGWMTPRGGCAPPEPPRSRKICLIFGLRTFSVSAPFWA